MKFQPPFDPAFLDPVNGIYNSNPSAPYVNGDPRIGRAGSIPPMESVDHPMKELIHLITHASLTPSHEDLQQVRKAVKVMDERAVRRGGAGMPIYEGLDATGVHKIRGLLEGFGIRLSLVESAPGSGEFDVKIESTLVGAGGSGDGGTGGSGSAVPLSNRLVFDYTGAEQTWTVPSGTTLAKFKMWGAGGGQSGGPGGYTEGIIAVTAAQVFKIVVGAGGLSTTALSGLSSIACPYGLGGAGAAVPGNPLYNEVGSGGGLTGAFLTSVSKANARFIAGGGGGGGDGAWGGSGNDPVNSGGQTSSMSGEGGSASPNSYGGGGGGGYEGGDAGQRRKYPSIDNYAGEGGKGFAHASATAVQNLYNPEFSSSPPNTSDTDYTGSIGVPGISGVTDVSYPGRLVIYYN